MFLFAYIACFRAAGCELMGLPDVLYLALLPILSVCLVLLFGPVRFRCVVYGVDVLRRCGGG